MVSRDFGADGNNENRLTVLFCDTSPQQIVRYSEEPYRTSLCAKARAFIAEPFSKCVFALFAFESLRLLLWAA